MDFSLFIKFFRDKIAEYDGKITEEKDIQYGKQFKFMLNGKTDVLRYYKKPDFSQIKNNAEFKEELSAFYEGRNYTVSDSLIQQEKRDKKPVIRQAYELSIYVDGSYTGDLTGYGLIIVKDNKLLYKEYGYLEEETTTRQFAGELYAAIRGVEWCVKNEVPCVSMFFDYTGIELFLNGEWKPKVKESILYYKKMKEYMKEIKIDFVKVKSHSGDYWNEEVDKLAKLGASGLSSL